MAPRYSHLPAEHLHGAFVQALDGRVCDHSPLGDKPLEADLAPPCPLRLRAYVYTATHPPGGRTIGEHKVQLMIPGQQRGQRANFDYSDGRIVFLLGYEPELCVFILWDAGLYRDFPFSRNVQVRAETVYEAYATGFALQERRLWGGPELVIAAHATRLSEALELRRQESLDRLLGGRHA